MTNILKIAALVLAIALIVGVLFFANSLVGNPLSKELAEETAEKYLEENYGDKDYEIDEVSYSFKDGYYHAYVTSESSKDTRFTLLINGFGKLKYDNYDYNVTSGWSTAERLAGDYRGSVEELLESNSFPYGLNFGYGELMFTTSEQKDDPFTPSYALVTNELVLDAYYNVNELGSKAGKITVYLEDANVSYERMAQILLGIRECFDNAGLGFYAIDCVLECPLDGAEYEMEKVEVLDFLYSDISEDGLVERVKAADEAAKTHFGI